MKAHEGTIVHPMQTVKDKDIALLVEGVTGKEQLGQILRHDSKLLGWIAELDSMAIMNLIVALEKQYGFRWHDDEMEESIFKTLGSLTNFVQSKVDAMMSSEHRGNNNPPSV